MCARSRAVVQRFRGATAIAAGQTGKDPTETRRTARRPTCSPLLDQEPIEKVVRRQDTGIQSLCHWCAIDVLNVTLPREDGGHFTFIDIETDDIGAEVKRREDPALLDQLLGLKK